MRSPREQLELLFAAGTTPRDILRRRRPLEIVVPDRALRSARRWKAQSVIRRERAQTDVVVRDTDRELPEQVEPRPRHRALCQILVSQPAVAMASTQNQADAIGNDGKISGVARCGRPKPAL